MPALSLYDARYFCPSPVLNGVETSRLRLRPSPYLLLPPFSSPSLTSCKPISLSIANCFERGRSISGSRSEGGCADAENGVEAKGWIHFVGVGGCGLSALAMLALLQGFEVSGSDITWSSFMDRLQKAGARLFVGHSSSNIQRDHRGAFPSAVVYSSAVPLYNEEVLRARSAGIPTYKRDRWLFETTRHHTLIAISGTHGKTTTTGMLAYVLNAMGDDLTAVVGANMPQLGGGNVIFGLGQNFVLEADEYDGCFLGLSPYVAVVTNIEWEHVDIFPNEDAVKKTFRKFLQRIRKGGHLILCGDSAGAYSLVNESEHGNVSNRLMTHDSEVSNVRFSVTTYGISTMNEWCASSIVPNSQGGSDYVLYHMGIPVAEISLQLPGVHNVLNSLAVIVTVLTLVGKKNVTYEVINNIKLHLKFFCGVARRFEKIGEIHGCHIYDDYAHHPTEIRAVLQAARQQFPFHTLWVVFQPHTFSRLAALMKDFAAAFRDANHVIVTEIYAARETNVWNVDGRDLLTAITGPSSEYIKEMGNVVDKLVHDISKDGAQEIVILTLGAGDITTVGPRLLRELKQRDYVSSEHSQCL